MESWANWGYVFIGIFCWCAGLRTFINSMYNKESWQRILDFFVAVLSFTVGLWFLISALQKIL